MKSLRITCAPIAAAEVGDKEVSQMSELECSCNDIETALRHLEQTVSLFESRLAKVLPDTVPTPLKGPEADLPESPVQLIRTLNNISLRIRAQSQYLTRINQDLCI